MGFDALSIWNDPKNAGLRDRRPDGHTAPGRPLVGPDAPITAS
jgi:hypothetical protein